MKITLNQPTITLDPNGTTAKENKPLPKPIANMGSKLPVTALERSMERLAASIRKSGYEVELDVFKSGVGGWWGASYVEITIEKDDTFEMVMVKANGYGTVMPFKAIREQILTRLSTKN
tara:strand:+ start:1579 stop:1935 length:357 start_codon:yes stop_codon:yes gene_type:complete